MVGLIELAAGQQGESGKLPINGQQFLIVNGQSNHEELLEPFCLIDHYTDRVDFVVTNLDLEIVETARRERIDLITIPTHGLSGVSRFFLGSVVAVGASRLRPGGHVCLAVSGPRRGSAQLHRGVQHVGLLRELLAGING